jgi:hypothetical protein
MVRDQDDTTRGHVAPILGVLGAVGLTIASVALRPAQVLVALPHPRGHRSFVELEADAVRQWETIEKHRRLLVPATFDAAAPISGGGMGRTRGSRRVKEVH